ncbi:AraC family transcriptional regulator [Microbacterium protaetiae]|uniref:AraC family transcriptional regulator n=1 Tax=Microbacterium protaetiae TaxID=2509458 RepID=A0A4P6EB99_9MICO|nr:AraC family transcriptional regulator [Microbacterium protaetiae]QAY59422.1 AraC family transcriptional regulator [Microbacterium protaetiae]
MATIDPGVLDDVLSRVEVRPGTSRRTPVSAGGVLPVASGVVTLIYVVDGAVGVDAPTAPSTLCAGDALLSMGLRPLVLVSAGGARVMTVDLELSGAPAMAEMPPLAWVTGFADREPAAAALAANLGAGENAASAQRSGDPVICRLMVSTVLLSLIRAWAQLGCVPQGWAQRRDPYLDRVVEAIHDDPGRDWSLELLATMGAMSRSVFAERFRRAIGMSPAGYVTEVRMRRAKDLLDAGLPVSATSRRLGYGSDEGFSRAFRRHTGLAPSAWQRRRDAVPA